MIIDDLDLFINRGIFHLDLWSGHHIILSVLFLVIKSAGHNKYRFFFTIKKQQQLLFVLTGSQT